MVNITKNSWNTSCHHIRFSSSSPLLRILWFTNSLSLHRICVLSYVPFTYHLLYLPFSLPPLRSLFIHLIRVLPLFLHRIRVLSYVPFTYHRLYLPFSLLTLRSLLWHARRHNQLTCKDKAGEKKWILIWV